jgi:hypothetical protein
MKRMGAAAMHIRIFCPNGGKWGRRMAKTTINIKNRIGISKRYPSWR